MNIRHTRRLALWAAVAATALTGLAATTAHADTLPGNTSIPFPAATYGNGCSFPGPNVLFDISPPAGRSLAVGRSLGLLRQLPAGVRHARRRIRRRNRL